MPGMQSLDDLLQDARKEARQREIETLLRYASTATRRAVELAESTRGAQPSTEVKNLLADAHVAAQRAVNLAGGFEMHPVQPEEQQPRVRVETLFDSLVNSPRSPDLPPKPINLDNFSARLCFSIPSSPTRPDVDESVIFVDGTRFSSSTSQSHRQSVFSELPIDLYETTEDEPNHDGSDDTLVQDDELATPPQGAPQPSSIVVETTQPHRIATGSDQVLAPDNALADAPLTQPQDASLKWPVEAPLMSAQGPHPMKTPQDLAVARAALQAHIESPSQTQRQNQPASRPAASPQEWPSELHLFAAWQAAPAPAMPDSSDAYYTLGRYFHGTVHEGFYLHCGNTRLVTILQFRIAGKPHVRMMCTDCFCNRGHLDFQQRKFRDHLVIAKHRDDPHFIILRMLWHSVNAKTLRSSTVNGAVRLLCAGLPSLANTETWAVIATGRLVETVASSSNAPEVQAVPQSDKSLATPYQTSALSPIPTAGSRLGTQAVSRQPALSSSVPHQRTHTASVPTAASVPELQTVPQLESNSDTQSSRATQTPMPAAANASTPIFISTRSSSRPSMARDPASAVAAETPASSKSAMTSLTPSALLATRARPTSGLVYPIWDSIEHFQTDLDRRAAARDPLPLSSLGCFTLGRYFCGTLQDGIYLHTGTCADLAFPYYSIPNRPLPQMWCPLCAAGYDANDFLAHIDQIPQTLPRPHLRRKHMVDLWPLFKLLWEHAWPAIAGFVPCMKTDSICFSIPQSAVSQGWKEVDARQNIGPCFINGQPVPAETHVHGHLQSSETFDMPSNRTSSHSKRARRSILPDSDSDTPVASRKNPKRHAKKPKRYEEPDTEPESPMRQIPARGVKQPRQYAMSDTESESGED